MCFGEGMERLISTARLLVSLCRRVHADFLSAQEAFREFCRFDMPEFSKRLRDPDYGATCRARLSRDKARKRPT